jgi:hypothetical protein
LLVDASGLAANNGIRIDPTPDTKGRVEFKWVRIKAAGGRTVIEWKFGTP